MSNDFLMNAVVKVLQECDSTRRAASTEQGSKWQVCNHLYPHLRACSFITHCTTADVRFCHNLSDAATSEVKGRACLVN